MTQPTAILLGASGSVGQVLLTEILRSGKFGKVIVLARSSIGAQRIDGTPVVEVLVPEMDATKLRQAVVDALADESTEVVGFSVLGVGAGTAKLSLAQHRAIDVELNSAFAAGLKVSGKVRHLAFMSAIGADINARASGSGAAGMPRYARVKGEAEQAVRGQGLEVVSIFQPSVIIGSKHTPKVIAAAFSALSFLMPAKYRAIRTSEIARAMVAAALDRPKSSAVYTYAEMKALARRIEKWPGLKSQS
ncbi:NAD(P)H-binding protein [Hydrogenophaga sp. 5NK40-0174]|uniref:NAD(P)H-binding protein n=1 Tax=Hydrogenophaga sp. 5NK40-0174 TaxID=3127649 RepID=UPI0031099470